MDYFLEFAVFSGKVIIIVVGIVAVLLTIASLALKSKESKPLVSIENLSKKYKKYKNALENKILDSKALKAQHKADKKKEKQSKKEEAKGRIFVLDFEGDIKASAVDHMRNEISALLTVAKDNDEVVVRLESGGGMVHSYGLASAQLLRIRERGLKLTVCVDKVAASGGYMMACTANYIVAAPFSILGSIGVLAQVPNFNKLLKNHDIDYQEIKAGEYKRTISMFGEITEKGKEKFLEQIEDTHGLFKEFVGKNRTQLNLSEVATGETWYGLQAIKKGLIDEVKTSDQYLMDRHESSDIFLIKAEQKMKVVEKILHSASLSVEMLFHKLSQRWI